MNNVVVKDNILTLDFKSDKLIQEEIIEDADINEPAFNSFCSNLVFS
ncbi:MAG: hypothetical protein IPP48_11770 [Chitinophagaceae bacterium]|nr:hypothetical protein [Chitinophagaceae bacterium]